MSEFQRIFFTHAEMLKLFRDCAEYKRSDVDSWIVLMKKLYTQILISIRFCSEAEYGYSNSIYDLFPYKQFEKDFNDHIEYYLEYFLPNEFAIDKGNNGMKNAIVQISNKYEIADVAKKDLESKFSNYFWTVIFYPDSLIGFSWHCACFNEYSSYASDSFFF